MNGKCVFCSIVKGEIPAIKVYEDADVLAFMDIGPVSKGHTLVIPKMHFDPVVNVPDGILARLIAVVKKIVRAQVKGLDAVGVNVAQANGAAAGQIVPHVHFHVIPRRAGDEPVRNWLPLKYESPDEMSVFAEMIKSGLKE